MNRSVWGPGKGHEEPLRVLRPYHTPLLAEHGNPRFDRKSLKSLRELVETDPLFSLGIDKSRRTIQ